MIQTYTQFGSEWSTFQSQLDIIWFHLGLLDYDKDYNQDCFGQYWDHDFYSLTLEASCIFSNFFF